jgi:predicted aspartyl protease
MKLPHQKPPAKGIWRCLLACLILFPLPSAAAQKVVATMSSTKAGGSASAGHLMWLPSDVDEKVPPVEETACSVGLIIGSQVHAQGVIKSTSSLVIPFELVSGFLVVVDGQIGNLDGLKFILDTGSTHSLIDRKVADRLRLQRRPGDVMNFNGYTAVEWADISGLRVGPLSTETLRVMVAKLAEFSEFAGADGIIGLDVLSRSRKFTIDYDRRTVSIQMADDGTPARSTSPYFVVPLVVQGLRMDLIVDTGLQVIVLYKNRLHKRLPRVKTEGKLTNVTMGRSRGTQATLSGVRIGGGEVVISVILIDGPDEDALPGVDGVLGTAFLSAKRIEFDFHARILRWQ